MCIIVDYVESVSETKIFVSTCSNKTEQLTIYSNKVHTENSNIMILPVPAQNVKYIDLSHHENFFDKLHKMCNPSIISADGDNLLVAKGSRGLLKVESVGSYFVSFAKTINDLKNIDTNIFEMTIKDSIIDVLKKYYDSNFSYILCKLKKGSIFKYHPFAYKHVLYNDSLFIPTRHIHDHGDNSVDKRKEYWEHDIYINNCNKISLKNNKNNSIDDFKDTKFLNDFDRLSIKLPCCIDKAEHISTFCVNGVFNNDDIIASV
jgi:hypothetical protein